jgi:hypothetical protein
MEIIITGILLGLVISFLSVSFYVLGLSHGKQVESGATVKLEPLKAITVPMNGSAKAKEDKKQEDDFTKQVNEILFYNGERKIK